MNGKESVKLIQDVQVEGLRRQSLHGGSIAIGNQALKFFLQTGSTMVMARLLTPEDFGVVAMVSSLLGFINLFLEFGLSTATVQKQSISGEELSGLFWINVLAGFTIMIVLILCAPLVAIFFNEPKANNMTMAFGGMALLGCLGSQHQALLHRQMRFGAIAICEILAMVVGIVSGLVAALYGLQFWSLIIMQGASIASGTFFLWWKSEWRPGFPRRTAGLTQLVKFGSSLTIANFLAYANHNLDNILLGKFFGEGAVGFYSRAQGLLNRPLSQVLPPMMRVAMPLFSRLLGDKLKFEKASLELTAIASFGGCLLLTTIFPTADWVVYLILGDQWMDAVPVFRMLAIFGLLEPLAWLLGTILVAAGKPQEMAKWRGVTIILVLISFIAGLPWGVIGVAMGYTISGIVTRIWLIFFAGNRIGISGFKFVSVSAPFVFIAGGTSLLLMGLRLVWTPKSALIGVISFFLLGTVIYILVLVKTANGRKFLSNLYQMGLDIIADFRGKK